MYFTKAGQSINNAIHISIFYHESNYISTDNRKRFYNAYNFPHFDCCCDIWRNYTHYLEEILSSTMFSGLKWMSFPVQVTYMKAIQMFKTIRGDSAEFHRSSFTFAYDIHAVTFII